MALMKMSKEFVDDLKDHPELYRKIEQYFEKIDYIGTNEHPYPVHVYRVSHPSLEPGDY